MRSILDDIMEVLEKRKFDVSEIRKDFPTLHQSIYKGKELIYFDNGATSQKPNRVIQAIQRYYELENSNVHRGVHYLSQLATDKYEKARKSVVNYINANGVEEVIFTKGATDSINLVASSFGQLLEKGDEIMISTMEHHSNIVPWQFVCASHGCKLVVVDINSKGELDMDDFRNKLNENTKLVAITHVSNTLGTVNPIKEIINLAHDKGAKVLIDGAQSIQHLKIDVQDLDCDFFAFSGHKVFAPTGIGVLYGKEELLNEMPPYQGGGDMIDQVTFEETTFNHLPLKFEAGTPNISGAIALGEAFEYLSQLNMEEIHQYEAELLQYAQDEIRKIEGVRIIGEASNKVSVLSFVVDGVHPSDIGTLLDKQGVATRTGHHCTQPLMDCLSIPGTVRASFAFYNTKQEIDIFIAALKKSLELLR